MKLKVMHSPHLARKHSNYSTSEIKQEFRAVPGKICTPTPEDSS